MSENGLVNRMYAMFLKKERESSNQRQSALVNSAFENPAFEKYRQSLKADLAYSLTEAMSDLSKKEKKVYKEQGMAGLVVDTLITSLDRVGMDPQDPMHLLFGVQFIQDFVPKDIYQQVINSVVARFAIPRS